MLKINKSSLKSTTANTAYTKLTLTFTLPQIRSEALNAVIFTALSQSHSHWTLKCLSKSCSIDFSFAVRKESCKLSDSQVLWIYNVSTLFKRAADLHRPLQFMHSSSAPQGCLPFSITYTQAGEPHEHAAIPAPTLPFLSALISHRESFHRIQDFTVWES